MCIMCRYVFFHNYSAVELKQAHGDFKCVYHYKAKKCNCVLTHLHKRFFKFCKSVSNSKNDCIAICEQLALNVQKCAMQLIEFVLNI